MLKFCFLILLLGSALALRISEEKCQEYKDQLKVTTCIGFSVFDSCPTKIESYDCHGVSNTGLIVGGVEATPGEFPHMAAIGYPSENGVVAFKCGGSLISDRFVLTAAHCFWDIDNGAPILVRLGVQNLATNKPDSVAVELKIKNFIKHPEYNSNDNLNDIALIELDETVKFDKKLLRPACLQQQEYFGSNATATGWGKNITYGQTMDTLMKVVLPIVDVDKCEKKFENNLEDEKQICAGGVMGKDTCQGDSGAPIQVSHFDAACVYDVIGLTSYGPPKCGSKNQYSVYTKAMYYLDWIEDIVWPAAEDTAALPEATTAIPEARISLETTTLRKKPVYVSTANWN